MPKKKLDEFTKSYIEAALWSSTDEDDDPLDGAYDASDIAPETLEEMISDCENFQEENAEMIERDLRRAGHDFWLTRNRHGAGFWDGDWPKPTDRKLTDAAHVYGEVNLYVGDDGLIYS